MRLDTLLHEKAHQFANDLDPSAVRRIKGIKAGYEGTPPGTRGRHAYRLTQDDHEWFVDQFLLWAKDESNVHPTLHPLMAQLRDDIAKSPQAHDIWLRSIQPLEQAVTRADAAVKAGKAAGASPAEMKALRATARDAKAALKEAKEAGGRLSPEMKTLFDELSEAGKRSTPLRMWDDSESLMYEHAVGAHARASRGANNLVHFRGERSVMERSLNHPFFGMYPLSYMYGKVLPELVEFLMFRPFGMKAPGVAASVTNRMYQSFMNQQESDPELRQFLFENEPAIRMFSMFIPGVPWDLPVNAPLWVRRTAEAMLTNIDKGREPMEGVDMGKIISDTLQYQVGPYRSFETFGEMAEAAGKVPGLINYLSGGGQQLPEGSVDTTTGPFAGGQQPGVAPAPAPVATGSYPETINVGRASIPSGQIEGTIQNQMRELEQALQGAGQ